MILYHISLYHISFIHARVSAADIRSIVNGKMHCLAFNRFRSLINILLLPSFGSVVISIDEINEATSILHKQESPTKKPHVGRRLVFV